MSGEHQTIEQHRLHELILKDLAIYKVAKIGDINQRIGSEINPKRIIKTD